jgi:hypothetical protein
MSRLVKVEPIGNCDIRSHPEDKRRSILLSAFRKNDNDFLLMPNV